MLRLPSRVILFLFFRTPVAAPVRKRKRFTTIFFYTGKTGIGICSSSPELLTLSSKSASRCSLVILSTALLKDGAASYVGATTSGISSSVKSREQSSSLKLLTALKLTRDLHVALSLPCPALQSQPWFLTHSRRIPRRAHFAPVLAFILAFFKQFLFLSLSFISENFRLK